MAEAVRVIEQQAVSRRTRNGAVIDADSNVRVAPYCRVSTDSEEQKESYKSQIEHYTNLIGENKNWEMVDMYADEGITGTKTQKRDDFNRLISDVRDGKIDRIVTKSISRFARNTLDTLSYVREFKALGVGFTFEKENLDTLSMDSEFVLTILSSVAQHESESISKNVNMGLQMKMKRGEMVGYNGCLGYDYDPETKTLTINEDEAEIVKYIFERYVDGGVGARTIGKECEEKGYLTKKGGKKWHDSTVSGILTNEKYYGALEQGKSFTLDPISKRRLQNMGEGRKYYKEKHHEAIIDIMTFAKAEDIRRSRNRNSGKGIRNQQCSHKYTFSNMIECGFCGGGVSRRSHSGGTKNKKVVWHCTASSKRGKKECPESKSMQERVIEEAFVQSFNTMCSDNKDLLDGFINDLRATLNDSSDKKELDAVQRKLDRANIKKDNLIDMKIEGLIEASDYKSKYNEVLKEIEKLTKELGTLELSNKDVMVIEERIKRLSKAFDIREPLQQFDATIFKEVVEGVIIGGKDNDGKADPYLITFVYKSGFLDKPFSVGKSGKNLAKNDKVECSDKNSSLLPSDTCGDCC